MGMSTQLFAQALPEVSNGRPLPPVVSPLDDGRLNSPDFWVENFLILLLGALLITLMMRLIRTLASHAPTSVPLGPVFILVRWVGWLIVFGLILERFRVEIMTILTTMLAMVAIGVVAVWSILSHVSASFLLMTTKPFRINDMVQFVGEEVKGRVVDLNLFYTTLQISDTEKIQVPNNMFFQKAVQVTRGQGETDLGAQFINKEPAKHDRQPPEETLD